LVIIITFDSKYQINGSLYLKYKLELIFLNDTSQVSKISNISNCETIMINFLFYKY